jgi:hypothetical protein
MTDGGPGERLERAAQARCEAQGLQARLEAATAYAAQAHERVQECRASLGDEERDVERLEGLSWSRILTSLRGSTATALEKEQAERDAARYALADAEAREQLAVRDVESLRAQLADLGDVDAELTAALAEREAETQDPELRDELVRISARRGQLAAEDREGREAFEAGQVAREHLLHARSLLGSARSWSTWDTFGGGGMLTDMMKYDKLDQVADVLRRADQALRVFTRELGDLHLAGVEALNLDSLTRVFDVFFDNIFTDLRVRSRIQDAELRVGDALAQVEATMQRLSERGRQIAAEQAELSGRREQLLLS